MPGVGIGLEDQCASHLLALLSVCESKASLSLYPLFPSSRVEEGEENRMEVDFAAVAVRIVSHGDREANSPKISGCS